MPSSGSFGLSINFSLLATMATITPELLSKWHRDASRAEEDFVGGIPKIELHIHLEGTLTPSLRWELAQKHQLTICNNRTGRDYGSLEEMEASYYPVLAPGYKHSGSTTFFEDYMGGFEVLRDEDDFFQLAMNYFNRAAAMNIRYCEVFFDPQGHTTRGVPFQTFMSGLRRAKELAESQLNVSLESYSRTISSVLRFNDLGQMSVHCMYAPRHGGRIGFGTLQQTAPISRCDMWNWPGLT